MPGSGKSFAAKRELVNVFLATRDRIIVVDPMGEYSPLIKRLGGQVIEIAPDSPHHINPMDIDLSFDEENPMALKADFILSLMELIVGGKDGLQPVERTVIDRCVRQMYREHLQDPETAKMPTLQTLYDLLCSQPEGEAVRLATALEIYVSGSLNVFNHETNVDLNRRLVCLDLKKLGAGLRTIAMLIMQDLVNSQVSMNFLRGIATWCYFDEFHVLLRDRLTASYCVAIWKMLRKKGCVPSALTQNVKDFLASPEIENICDNVPYGGYYTQDEIREVVAYAAARGITVVPEIDLPGHMLAALACYPELGCTGGPYEVETGWGVFEDVLCPGKEKTFEFLENVLTEVMELFPSEYIHIGGDECPKTRWEKCPACQARIKALGLKDDDRHSAEHYLQSYVTARIEKFLNEHGRRIIGWDEILEGELAPNATVMSWRGTEGGIYAAKMGHDAIMTPTTYCYLDYCQASDPENEPLNIGGYVPVEKLYSYEPVPDSLVNDYGKYIIGVQANLWTEYIPTNEQLEYMLLPRVAALSEVQWCDRGTREWPRFAQALPHMLQIYDRMGLNYATTVFGVTGLTEKNAETGAEEIVLSTIDQTPIHYTLDGSEPTAESPVYTDPIALDKEYTVKAAVFREEIPTRTFSKTFAPTAEKEE